MWREKPVSRLDDTIWWKLTLYILVTESKEDAEHPEKGGI